MEKLQALKSTAIHSSSINCITVDVKSALYHVALCSIIGGGMKRPPYHIAKTGKAALYLGFRHAAIMSAMI